jgi:hypothetical protein
LTRINDNSGIYKVDPGKKLVLRCYKCQVSVDVVNDPTIEHPALLKFVATHQPHGQMFVGTVDDGGKFQAIEGPGEFLDLEHEDDPSN